MTMSGHHIYVKDGKVLAGSVPAVSGGAKKATKPQLQKHQANVDAEAKAAAKQKRVAAKKGSAASGGAAKGNSRGAGKAVDGEAGSSAGKPAAKRKPAAGKEIDSGTVGGAGKKPVRGKQPATLTVPVDIKPDRKPAAKPKSPKAAPAGRKQAKAPGKVADIRSEAQANRELAYDVGDKVGGARKDTFQKNFTTEPTTQNLEALEKVAPEVAQKMCVKKNILPPVDFEQEQKNGVEINAAMLKQLIYDRIAPKPVGDKPEDRAAYLNGIRQLHRVLAPIKTWDNLRKSVSELGTIAREGDGLAELKHKVANSGSASYFNHDYYNERISKAEAAKKVMDFEAMGDKLNNFFTNGNSRVRTFQTVVDKKLNWDTYFKPSEAAANGADEKDRSSTRGAGRKKWERMAVSEHQRTGGKETTVKKPEDMVKQFNMKGVEFGNWVDDSSGLYHLKRASEAFSDLADIIGVEDKDVSLNGRLSIAFGARGKAGAVAHYEPDRKVINMTKFGGAGSLAHEWGHAMDNIMYAYSHGSAGSLSLASDAPQSMGDSDPELKSLYGTLMDAVRKPAPGQSGGVTKISIDSTARPAGSYYPSMRREIEAGDSPETVYTRWKDKIDNEYDRAVSRVMNSSFVKSDKDREKRIKIAQRNHTKELNALPHMVAYEMKRKTGAEYKGEIQVPTGKSEYYTRMQEFDGGGKSYYAQGCEMFARVFESMIEDKLTAKKRKNNYLVWDTKTSKGNLDAPFPVGDERKHMHAAMDALLKHITKTKALKKAMDMELRKSMGDISLTEIRNKELTGRYDGHVLFNEQELRAKGNDYVARLAAMQARRDPDAVVSGITERSAYAIDHETDPSEVIYIPVNRLKMVYQTEEATNWDKVRENMEKMTQGVGLKPVEIGYDDDVHDGHHRWIASKEKDYTHVPCIVKGKDEAERREAIAKYRVLWKSIIADPAGNDPFGGDPNVMYRGIGQKELEAINAKGYVQTKGKGNDDDKEAQETCFTNLFEQALGYAISQYDLYDETAAYVIALPKPPWIEEDEHGELVSRQPVPFGVGVIVPIPNPDEDRKIFNDGETLRE